MTEILIFDPVKGNCEKMIREIGARLDDCRVGGTYQIDEARSFIDATKYAVIVVVASVFDRIASINDTIHFLSGQFTTKFVVCAWRDMDSQELNAEKFLVLPSADILAIAIRQLLLKSTNKR